ncbi:Detected protein of confused Function [Hibiscus syriacus]|uniref:Detected protein of confused Function n=1 Tax=Hibiscus syriacus TaxID=106335 RepID=A0A6A3D2L8_HIBSY|nr:Detected protein of confused Function [Hibiscus syriacus]
MRHTYFQRVGRLLNLSCKKGQRKIQVLQGCGRDELLNTGNRETGCRCWDLNPKLAECTSCWWLYEQTEPSFGFSFTLALVIMNYSSLPHFCRKEGSGSSRNSSNGTVDNCFSLDHTYHQQLYDYIKQQATLVETGRPIKQGSVHVDFPEPDPEDAKIANTIKSEFQKLADQNGSNPRSDVGLADF